MQHPTERPLEAFLELLWEGEGGVANEGRLNLVSNPTILISSILGGLTSN